LNNGQSGVIRLAALRKTRLDRMYPGGDFPLMCELAMLGRFLVLPEVLLYRRMGPSTFSRGLQGDAESVFYGKPAETVAGHQIDMHFDVVRAALTLPLPFKERCMSAAFILRRLAWQRRHVYAEIRNLLGLRKP
jgi:hypothetical protein